MEESPMKVKVPSKRQRIGPDFKKCLFCQQCTNVALSSASAIGIKTFFKTLKQRKEGGDCALYDELKSFIIDEEEEWSWKSTDMHIMWHRGCYSSFTSQEHLSRTVQESSSTECFQSLSRYRREEFDWKSLCMFCGKKSYKRDKKLINVSTFEFCTTLDRCVNERRDEAMKCRVGDFTKLIALEARYHKGCHSLYINVKKQSSTQSQSFYDDALHEMMEDVMPELEMGKALDINNLLLKYQTHLTKYLSDEDAHKYTRQKLKIKLETLYGETVQIYHVSSKAPDVVISKHIDVQDMINSLASIKQTLHNIRIEQDVTMELDRPDDSPRSVLYHAALILRSACKQNVCCWKRGSDRAAPG